MAKFPEIMEKGCSNDWWHDFYQRQIDDPRTSPSARARFISKLEEPVQPASVIDFRKIREDQAEKQREESLKKIYAEMRRQAYERGGWAPLDDGRCACWTGRRKRR